MIRAMWTAATGMTAQQINVDTIAHNLANVKYERLQAEPRRACGSPLPNPTPSRYERFKRRRVSQAVVGSGVRLITVAKEWLQGNVRMTSNELDLAIDGPGFFQVARPDGTIMYTRTDRSSATTSATWSRATVIS
ncbi:MAG: flagellar hook-basal body complex protein [Nitrospiraceae bacterium]